MFCFSWNFATTPSLIIFLSGLIFMDYFLWTIYYLFGMVVVLFKSLFFSIKMFTYFKEYDDLKNAQKAVETLNGCIFIIVFNYYLSTTQLGNKITVEFSTSNHNTYKSTHFKKFRNVSESKSRSRSSSSRSYSREHRHSRNYKYISFFL